MTAPLPAGHQNIEVPTSASHLQRRQVHQRQEHLARAQGRGLVMAKQAGQLIVRLTHVVDLHGASGWEGGAVAPLHCRITWGWGSRDVCVRIRSEEVPTHLRLRTTPTHLLQARLQR